MLFDDFNLFGHGKIRQQFARFEVVFYLAEYPGLANSRPAYHDAVDAVFVKGFFGFFGRGDVAVAEYRYFYPGVAFHPGNRLPVGFTGIHLRAGTPVYRQGLDADVLQAFGNVFDDDVFAIPAETSFRRYGDFNGIHNLPGHLHHQGDVFQHSRPRSFLRHAFHRTTEIQVNEVGLHFFDDFRRFHHRVDVSPVNLDGHRTFRLINGQFFQRFVDRPHQRIGRNEFGIEPVRPVFFAKFAERGIRHVFHRCQYQRPVSYFLSGDFHKSR